MAIIWTTSWETTDTAGMLNHRFSYHDYGSDLLKGQLVENRQTLRKKFDQYPGWKPWMSEYCVMTGSEGKGGDGRDLTMSTALDVARIIHLDLTLVGVTAWQWWTAVSGVNYKDGLIFTDWKKPGDAESIITSRLLWAIGNYSRFVRPGMRRVELEGKGHDIRGLMGSAYRDEKARQVVAVYINMETGSADGSARFRSRRAPLAAQIDRAARHLRPRGRRTKGIPGACGGRPDRNPGALGGDARSPVHMMRRG